MAPRLLRSGAVWFLLVLLLTTGCGGSAAGPSPAPGAPPRIKVRFTEVIHSVFYAPQYIAQAKGFFQAEGIDLDTTTAQGSDKGAAALLAGTADIALVGPETTVFVHNQETPVQVKIFAQMTTKDGSFLVARKAEPFDWQNLKGKTVIGWRPGSMPQMVAATVLQQHDLKPGQVTYVSNLAAPAMAGAFLSGQGDYLQVYEPVASQLEQQGAGKVVASFGQAYGNVPVTGYVATTDYLTQHAETVQRFTNAIYKATRWLETAEPAEVGKLLAPYFPGTSDELLAASIARYKAQESWKSTPVMNPQDFARMQVLLVTSGVLDAGKEAPFDEIAVNRFAETAVATAKP